jgi:hypothetical protein
VRSCAQWLGWRIHAGKLGVERRDTSIIFIDRRSGHALSATPPRRPRVGPELEDLDRFMHDAGVEIDAHTNEPKWDGTAMKLAESLDWLLLAEPPAKPETSPVCC